MKINLKTCSMQKFLQVLRAFSSEACASMQEGDSYKAGLYLRRIEEAMKIREIELLAIDDVDMTEGCVYTSRI